MNVLEALKIYCIYQKKKKKWVNGTELRNQKCPLKQIIRRKVNLLGKNKSKHNYSTSLTNSYCAKVVWEITAYQKVLTKRYLPKGSCWVNLKSICSTSKSEDYRTKYFAIVWLTSQGKCGKLSWALTNSWMTYRTY